MSKTNGRAEISLDDQVKKDDQVKADPVKVEQAKAEQVKTKDEQVKSESAREILEHELPAADPADGFDEKRAIPRAL